MSEFYSDESDNFIEDGFTFNRSEPPESPPSIKVTVIKKDHCTSKGHKFICALATFFRKALIAVYRLVYIF